MKETPDSPRYTGTQPDENGEGSFRLKRARTRKKRGRSVLEMVKDVKIEVIEPAVTSTTRPFSITLPGFSTETTEVGVAEICRNKALYLRLSMRSDN